MASETSHLDVDDEYSVPPVVVFLAGFLPAGFAATTFVGHTVMEATGGQPTTTPWFFAFYIGLLLIGVSLMYVGVMRGVEEAVTKAN
ncbi:hypothetical protein B4589_002505 [Halolamina sp. CBA1230]|uniref:hypothetical protein n=1 Tax=Halolamina sp. CBA1230 TaxID=1853690 RepID=UPI0009A1A6A0|nr:hypothetical protein [Halolamina sp. CBA1230]QKY19301.1 hypothetical protein B4589_002505 [Halolamina sp. CBA1230]